MKNYTIEKLNIEDYEKCNNIWDMSTCEFTEKFRREIEENNRVVYSNDGLIFVTYDHYKTFFEIV